MKIPKNLKVGGQTYKVLERYKFTETVLAGQSHHRGLEIRLADKEDCGNLYARGKIEECFIHELLHCVDNVYNCSGLDESTVDRLSNGLYQVLNDNKMLK